MNPCLFVAGAALVLTLAPGAGAHLSTDLDLARAVRDAVRAGASGRLVSHDALMARARGRSDLELAREASDSIRRVLGSRLAGLVVSVDEGVIELRGKARDPAAARQAAQLAEALPGASGVRSWLGGAGTEPGARAGAAPAAVPHEASPAEPLPGPFSFATDRLLGGEGLNVQVERGMVRVSGRVNSAQARSHVMAAARSVSGVRGVVDELVLAERDLGSDLGLLGVLRSRLSNLPELWPVLDGLELTVRSGVVRVSGDVQSRAQRDVIEVLLLATRGVMVVVSDLHPVDGPGARGAPAS